LKDAYQLYEAADAFVNLGKWEANPKGLSWGVPSSGKQMVKSGDFVNGEVFLSLYYNIPDEATVKKIAEANGLEPKQDAEHGTYYEFPLVFEREKLNNKDGKLLDWVGTNNTKISATYVDGSICIPVTGVEPTTTTAVTTTTPAGSTATTTKTELTVNGPTMAVNKGEDVVVTPGQEYAEIPLNLYNVPDTEGITVAFKTDAEGTPTLALLKDAYQLYEAADAFVNLGKWEANPKGLSWGVPSSGKQMVKSGDFADGDVFLSLYYNIPDEATVKDIAEANGLELKHNAEYGAYYEFPLVFEREKLNNKDGKLLDWVGTNNTKVNATYIDSNLIVKVSDTGETTTTATTTSGGETTTTEVVTTASSAPVTTSPDATTTTTSVSYNGESFEWVLGKYKADGSYEPRTFVKAGQKSASAVAPKVYGDPGINSANIRLEGDAAKALLAAGTYVGLTKNADYDTQLAGEGGTTWLDNAAQLRFAFASNDVNNTNNAKTADGSAIGELVYDIPDAETVKSIADQYGISLVTGTDDEGNEVSYYEFPLTWSEAVGEHGETATQCGSYVDGALVEIPYDQYTRRDGTICVVVPSETTTTAATTTTAEVTTTTEAVTTAAVDTTTEVPATTTTAAATTTTEAATTTTEAATTTTEAATTTTEAATTTTEAVTTTTEAATTTTEAATTTTEAATTTTEAVTTTTEAATTTTEAATTTTEAATTTTEATTTSTTEATTTTSATTTQPQPNVTTIVFELADPNFYFSVDEREFKATDLFKSVTLISTDADGKIVSQEDIIDKVNFNGATPKSTYVQADKYYAGTIQAYYNNGTENVLIPDATPTVYIGVKGDADLNGLEDVPDAVSILTYYAKIAAGQQGIVFNEDPMLNKLAYFLADVDTESKAGENTDGKLMEVNDAVYVLTYYAKKAAGQGPTWPDVIPSLKSLEGSMWYEG
ncbi:MAG: cellulose-binding protein CttA-related protein, partial [Ruminococcus sp.]|nr:cellulose-binding protein CttA-related protein [Ruminococcus sp.]